jgi:hypothetical protein
MAFRASAITNIGISPFDVIFAKPMSLPIDWSLMQDDPTTQSGDAYIEEIRPKLQILHRLAVEDARDSADSRRDKRNKDDVFPTFKTGDKVLLFDPTIK